jgi:hypothetical protein
MIKLEYVSEDNGETVLLEFKRNGSQYEMYIDGKLRGATGQYETCRNEAGEYAASVVKQLFDKVIEDL